MAYIPQWCWSMGGPKSQTSTLGRYIWGIPIWKSLSTTFVVSCMVKIHGNSIFSFNSAWKTFGGPTSLHCQRELTWILELCCSPRLAPTAFATCICLPCHARVWRWKDEQLQQARWTLVCSHYVLGHTHQSVGLMYSERIWGRAVGCAAIVSCCALLLYS